MDITANWVDTQVSIYGSHTYNYFKVAGADALGKRVRAVIEHKGGRKSRKVFIVVDKRKLDERLIRGESVEDEAVVENAVRDLIRRVAK